MLKRDVFTSSTGLSKHLLYTITLHRFNHRLLITAQVLHSRFTAKQTLFQSRDCRKNGTLLPIIPLRIVLSNDKMGEVRNGKKNLTFVSPSLCYSSHLDTNR